MNSTQPNEQPPESEDRPNLRIRSQNLNKSLDAQEDWLVSMSKDDTTIGCAQEPYLDKVTNSRANSHWIAIYPSTHHSEVNKKRTRSFMIVKRSLDPDTWRQIAVDSPDVTAIQISDEHGDLLIINFYLDQNHSEALAAVDTMLRTRRRTQAAQRRTLQQIWIGDFNRHSPVWDEARNHHLFTRRNLSMADLLMTYAADYNMQMALPHGEPTLRANLTKNHTRPDNAFVSEELLNKCESCRVAIEQQPPKTDHYPIILDITLDLRHVNAQPRRNYRITDWKKFHDVLEAKLDEFYCRGDISTDEEFDEYYNEIQEAIMKTVEETVPWSTPCPYTKRWWSKDLDAQRSQCIKIGRHAWRLRYDPWNPVHEQARREKNIYARMIKTAKEVCWDEFVANFSDADKWRFSKYINSAPTDASRARVPDLKITNTAGNVIRTASTAAEKADIFAKEFFPEVPPELEIDEDDHQYPPPKFDFAPLTDERVHDTIRKLQRYKATDTDEYSNAILIECADLLAPRYGLLFRAVHELNYWPEYWKYVGTLVLRKPGKGDYTIPGHHRPISLVKKIAMLYSKCLSEELLYNTEKFKMLTPTQFGFRPGRATTDSLHYVISRIKDAWRRGKVVALVLLDIKAAFPHIIVSVLVHRMRLKGVPKEYTDWIKMRFKGRKTRLAFDDQQSQEYTIDNGLDQGDGFSTVGMDYYIDDLLANMPDRENREEAVGFADDVGAMAEGDDLEEAAGNVEDMLVREEGALEWGKQSNCEFGMAKTMYMGMTRRREPNTARGAKKKTRPATRPDLIVNGTRIKPVTSAKFLGVILDQELRFHEHAAYAIKKGMTAIQQYQRITRTAKGIQFKHMREFYRVVVVTKMLYAADVWIPPPQKGGRGMKRFTSKLAAIQRQATILITGALRSTATDVLNAHADLMPFDQLIHWNLQRATLRLATLPEGHPLYKPVRRAAKRRVKQHRSPLHDLFHAYQIDPAKVEKIQSVRRGPTFVPQFQIEIAPDKAEAKTRAENAVEDVQIYTDGSEIDGMVGAAAVMYIGGRETETLHYHLGPATHYGVPEAEMVGELLAAHLLLHGGRQRQGEAIIGPDNQASILAMANQVPRGGHYLLDATHDILEMATTRDEDRIIIFRWTPGHVGFVGNETVDGGAKEAAKGRTSAAGLLPRILRKGPLPQSRSALRKQHKHKTRAEMDKIAEASAHIKKLKQKTDRNFRPSAYRKIAATLPRRHAALWIQLRTGHVPLNKYLHRIGRAESPDCRGCNRDARGRHETVAHYLLHCPAHGRAREWMRRELGRKASDIHFLLSDSKALPALFRFIARTRRFDAQFGDVELPEGWVDPNGEKD